MEEFNKTEPSCLAIYRSKNSKNPKNLWNERILKLDKGLHKHKAKILEQKDARHKYQYAELEQNNTKLKLWQA
jgi:hypothetical protein